MGTHKEQSLNPAITGQEIVSEAYIRKEPNGTPNANREHKSSLFAYIFHRKNDCLDLYNALSGTFYTDPEKLKIITIANLFYLGYENDVGITLENVMELWEHQSTFNPNMPLRGLGYFARMYQSYIKQNRLDVFSNTLQQIPFPEYYVFYNGESNKPERMELKLSDAFLKPESSNSKRKACLEVTAIMLNINYGMNQELMKKCRRLNEYAYFIAQIRAHKADGLSIEKALDLAIKDCIKKKVLLDIMIANSMEVAELFMMEYGSEEHLQIVRENAEIRGAHEQLKSLVSKKLAKGKTPSEIADDLEEDTSTIMQLIKEIQVPAN